MSAAEATWTYPDGTTVPVPVHHSPTTAADTAVKVVIDTPGPTITLEATGVLDDVTAKAMEIYREIVKDWPRPKDGIAAGSGFHTERSWPE